MIVTFETRGHPRVTMLGHIAKDLLRRIQYDATRDGAIRPEALAQVREKLAQSIEAAEAEAGAGEAAGDAKEQDRDQEPSVSLRHRALPLLALLEAADRRRDYVTWTVTGKSRG